MLNSSNYLASKYAYNICKPRAKVWFRKTAWKSDTRICFCHPYWLTKIQSLYFSNGNRYIGGIFHRLSVTSQARLFTDNKKLKSLFPLKDKNRINDSIIWDLRKDLILERKLPWVKKLNTITQLDKHIVWVPFLHKVFTMTF